MISWTSKIKHDGKIFYIQLQLFKRRKVYDKIMGGKNPDVTYFEQKKKITYIFKVSQDFSFSWDNYH